MGHDGKMPDQIGAAEIRFVTEGGDEIISQVRDHRISSMARAQPVRLPPSHAGQRHYPGLCWTRTTSDHVVYESLLERDRILLADFDPEVVWITAQPFWIAGDDKATGRRHCPDLLLTRADGSHLVVDVKHPRVAQKDEVKAVFAWTKQVCKRLGADYEIWTGVESALINNVRFASQARRESRTAQVQPMLDRFPDELSIASAEALLAAEQIARPRHIVLELLWTGDFAADLTQPLSGDTLIQRAEAA